MVLLSLDYFFLHLKWCKWQSNRKSQLLAHSLDQFELNGDKMHWIFLDLPLSLQFSGWMDQTACNHNRRDQNHTHTEIEFLKTDFQFHSYDYRQLRSNRKLKRFQSSNVLTKDYLPLAIVLDILILCFAKRKKHYHLHKWRYRRPSRAFKIRLYIPYQFLEHSADYHLEIVLIKNFFWLFHSIQPFDHLSIYYPFLSLLRNDCYD